MALICGIYAEQCLDRVHLLDLGGELLWVGTLSCARSPTFAIIVLLSKVNLHGSLPVFIPLLPPCFRSLIACFKRSPRCRAVESSSSLRTLPFMMLHIIHVVPLSQNGKLEPKWLRVRKSAVSDAVSCTTEPKLK